jgi:hypothetical protein
MLVAGNDFDAGNFFDRIEETGLAFFRAGGAGLVAQENDVAFAAEQFRHVFAREHAALVIVRGDKAHIFVRLQAGVHDDDGDFRTRGRIHRANQCLGVGGREHDSIHAPADEILNHLNLLVAIVLAQRPLPDDIHFHALAGEFALRFHGACMNRFPELV